MGAYHGRKSFETFSHHRAFMDRTRVPELAIGLRYPPYTESKFSWMSWFMFRGVGKESWKRFGMFKPGWLVYAATAVVFFAMKLHR